MNQKPNKKFQISLAMLLVKAFTGGASKVSGKNKQH